MINVNGLGESYCFNGCTWFTLHEYIMAYEVHPCCVAHYLYQQWGMI